VCFIFYFLLRTLPHGGTGQKSFIFHSGRRITDGDGAHLHGPNRHHVIIPAGRQVVSFSLAGDRPDDDSGGGGLFVVITEKRERDK
jgi:hypothetical protein